MKLDQITMNLDQITRKLDQITLKLDQITTKLHQTFFFYIELYLDQIKDVECWYLFSLCRQIMKTLHISTITGADCEAGKSFREVP